MHWSFIENDVNIRPYTAIYSKYTSQLAINNKSRIKFRCWGEKSINRIKKKNIPLRYIKYSILTMRITWKVLTRTFCGRISGEVHGIICWWICSNICDAINRIFFLFHLTGHPHILPFYCQMCVWFEGWIFIRACIIRSRDPSRCKNNVYVMLNYAMTTRTMYHIYLN